MKTQRSLAFIGAIGLFIHLALNILALFAFHRASAIFLSEQWWSSWFPGLMVWVVMLTIGFSAGLGSKREG
jgi:hypothetical protein